MAKATGNRTAGANSRIRFIMLEADLNDGDLNQITQAITSALRPASGQRALPALQRSLPANGDVSAAPSGEVENAIEETEEVGLADSPPIKSTSNGSTKVRTFREPKLIDVDLTVGDVPFPTYAKAKNPPDEATKKFLVVAGWFKEFGGVPGVTIDHVFSAFRLVKWSVNIPDFDLPFRQLVKRSWVKRNSTGVYEITHIGISELQNMGSEPVTGADATA